MVKTFILDGDPDRDRQERGLNQPSAARREQGAELAASSAGVRLVTGLAAIALRILAVSGVTPQF
jgi:hypothetical protein